MRFLSFIFLFTSFAPCTEEFALKHIGIREQGENKGYYVEQLQKRFGYPEGTKWCGIYAFACHVDCGVPKSTLPKNFALADGWNNPEKIVWRKGNDADLIQKGMTVLLRNSERVFHVGIVLYRSEDSRGDFVVYHSGNSRSSNVISGDGVHLSKLYLTSIYAIADYLTPVHSAAVKYHIVGPRENLYRISIKYSTTVEQLMKLNNLSNAVVYVGQELQVSE